MAGPGQHFSMSADIPVPGSMMTGQTSMKSYTQPSLGLMPGNPHQQSFTGPGLAATTMQPQMMSPTKTVNCVALCKLGQETNQELVNKLLDVFRLFKAMQLPNGTNNTQYHERRTKVDESLRQLNLLFRKLRLIYDKVSEMIDDPDENPEEVLVPLKGDPVEKNTSTETYKYVHEEHQQLAEQLQQKNAQLKEIIDKIRNIMWEINTMIVMRKT